MDGQKSGTKKVRKGDRVVVIAGNAKGQKGMVEACFGDKVIIGGINLRVKHVKKSKARPQGGKIDIECPIHISNVRACDEVGNPLKLQVRINDHGEREFFYLKEGEAMLWRPVKRSMN